MSINLLHIGPTQAVYAPSELSELAVVHIAEFIYILFDSDVVAKEMAGFMG